jgi:hypothetical protein
MKIKELDVVALRRDLPDANLRAGDPGTVVHIYSDGAYEVEFINSDGFTVGLLTLQSKDFRPATKDDLKRRPVGDLEFDRHWIDTPASR